MIRDIHPYYIKIKVNSNTMENSNLENYPKPWHRCCCCRSFETTSPIEQSNDDEELFDCIRRNVTWNQSKMDVASHTDKFEHGNGNNLLVALRVPLLLGSIVGLIPIRGLMAKCYNKDTFKFRWFHYRTLLTLMVTTGLLLHALFISYNFLTQVAHSRNSAGHLILAFSGVWFYAVGTLVYMFFLFKSRQLCAFFKTWMKVSNSIAMFVIPDKKVGRDINLITAVVLLDSLGENILYHFHAMKVEQRDRISSMSFNDFLHDYYSSNEYIFQLFNYSVFITFALLITNKLATYAWNYGDVFLILISRVVYGRYKALNKFMESQMEPDGSILMIRKGAIEWTSVRKNFLLVTNLLHHTNKLFSPLIWISYITDVFFVCRQLYEGFAIGPAPGQPVDKVYMVWSLLHLIMRTLGVNMMAARVNEEAHRTFKVLQHCHPEEYDDEVRRLERFLGSREIGISGNGCFIITRSFVLMIISAIFTLEVVLLQNAHLTVG